MKKTIGLYIFVCLMLAMMFVLGVFYGMTKAVESARLVEYSNSGYVIEYAIAGAHSYK